MISMEVMKKLLVRVLIVMQLILINLFPTLAMESNHTLPVYGNGAPVEPILSVPSFRLGQALTANARSTDPDEDPIQYQFRWCTLPKGEGTCVEGQTQTFNSPGNRYVVARAITPRGYPKETQGQSGWSKELVARMIGTPPVAKDVQIIGDGVVGQRLSGRFVYEDIDGDLAGDHYYFWYRTEDMAGVVNKVLISVGSEYTPTSEDIGHYLVFEVTPFSASGVEPRSGASVSAISAMPITEKTTNK